MYQTRNAAHRQAIEAADSVLRDREGAEAPEGPQRREAADLVASDIELDQALHRGMALLIQGGSEMHCDCCREDGDMCLKAL